MKNPVFKHLKFYWLIAIAIPLLTSCNALLNKQPLQTNYYSLETTQLKSQQNNSNEKLVLPVLTVSTPKAAAGFNTRHMLYTRNHHQIEHFARNEWVDTPANMLQSLLVDSIEKSGSFIAVVPKTSAVKSAFRLESEVLTLIQNFDTKPSHVRFSLRVTLVDNSTQQVVANQLFDEQINAISDNPAGGVMAANEAVNTVLLKVSAFTQQALRNYIKNNEVKP